MKKILFAILFIFCASFGMCDDEQTSLLFTIDDFSKGYNHHASEFYLSPKQCAVGKNLRFHDEFNSVSKRDPMVSTFDTSGDYVTSVYRYYNSDSTSRTVATTGTYLYCGDETTGTVTTLLDGLTDSQRWDFVTYKDLLIGGNGYDNTIKWDGSLNDTADTAGHRTADNLCADLGAPLADLTTGTDLSVSSWYQYKVLFKDSNDLYYYSDARSNAIQTGASVYTIALKDIPIIIIMARSNDVVEKSGNFYLNDFI